MFNTLYINLSVSEDIEFCRTLLEAGADPNFQTINDDNSLLLLSSYDGCLEIVKLLMKYGGNAGIANKLGYTPLHIAAWNGHVACVNEFLAAGIAHDNQTVDKNTPLALAAHGGHLPVIEVLLLLNCNVNNSDKDADTALHYAAYNGMTKACELLLSYGADPDAGNKVNATALWNAVYMSQKEVVKLLLLTNVKLEVSSKGINQHAHSDDVVYVFERPKSPLWVSVANNNPEIALLLISAGYDLHKEQWLIDRDFPDKSDERLRNVLTDYIQNPPRLVTRCRNFLRSYMGREITEKVRFLPIPITLKSYLTLSDLK